MQSHGILLGAGTNEMELLTVWINCQLFGINVAKIQSVECFDENRVTAMPEQPPEILGMLLYRNKTIPLMDLQILLGIEDSSCNSSIHDRDIVVVTEFNNKTNAFKVQGVNRIFRFSWSDFVPMSKVIGASSYVIGSVHADGNEIMVLDLEQVIASIFPDMVLEELSEKSMHKKEAVARDSLNILFAEDSSTIRKGVKRVLQEAGFINIRDFDNGQSALDYCTSKTVELTAPDSKTVLITDIEMPKMDGLTLCRMVKSDKQLSSIYVVVFSSLINTQMIEKCKKVQADSYVTKPETNSLIDILDVFCLS